MEILKEIARDKLIIMVTHNPELAERYSTRIVRLLDGSVVDDSAALHRKTQPQRLTPGTGTRQRRPCRS